MKNILKIVFGLTLLSGNASAATIGWGAAPASVNVGDSFSLSIVGSGFTSNVNGGGVNFTFDSSVLNVMAITIDESVWTFGNSTGVVDNTAGTVDGLRVNTFDSVTGNFDVATVMFEAVGAGVSLLDLTEFALNPWASNGVRLDPVMESASITVATPVPAAAWLFGSGLLGLVGMARRRKA